MSENKTRFYESPPLLLSEKILLAAKYYNLEQDPFVGLVEGRLNLGVQTKPLSRAYQSITSRRTTLQLLFEKKEDQFCKKIQASAFKELKEFKNKEAFLLWKNKTLDFETGPLHEMVVYKTFFKTILCFKFHHLILDGFSLFSFFKELAEAYHKILSGNLKSGRPVDSPAYCQLMADFFQQERENAEEKNKFWKEHLKTHALGKFFKAQQKTDLIQIQRAGLENVFLRRKHLKKIYKFKVKKKYRSVLSFFVSLFQSIK